MARTNLASGFAGFLIGVVTGCAICAAAAVFITNSPIPFVEKVQKVTADVDPAQKLAGGSIRTAPSMSSRKRAPNRTIRPASRP